MKMFCHHSFILAHPLLSSAPAEFDQYCASMWCIPISIHLTIQFHLFPRLFDIFLLAYIITFTHFLSLFGLCNDSFHRVAQILFAVRRRKKQSFSPPEKKNTPDADYG